MSSLVSCHLRESPGSLHDLTLVEEFHEDSHYGVWLSRCNECGQLYGACYVEVFDDSWSFYAPIVKEEAAALHNDYEKVEEFIQGRPHIVWPPPPAVPHWNEGREFVLTMGPRPW